MDQALAEGLRLPRVVTRPFWLLSRLFVDGVFVQVVGPKFSASDVRIVPVELGIDYALQR